MAKAVMITTTDNPYDPFTQWEQWLMFDTNQGYNTCARLARVTTISEQLSDEENFDSVENGINELIKFGSINKKGEIVEFKKIYK